MTHEVAQSKERNLDGMTPAYSPAFVCSVFNTARQSRSPEPSLTQIICSDLGTRLKEYRMVFRAGLRDPRTRDVARLELQASVFLRFPTEVEQHPKCMDHAILLGKPFGNCFIK
jgi:hypothetical protein